MNSEIVYIKIIYFLIYKIIIKDNLFCNDLVFVFLPIKAVIEILFAI